MLHNSKISLKQLGGGDANEIQYTHTRMTTNLDISDVISTYDSIPLLCCRTSPNHSYGSGIDHFQLHLTWLARNCENTASSQENVQKISPYIERANESVYIVL